MYNLINLTVLAAFMGLCFYCLEEPKPYDTDGVTRLLAEFKPMSFEQRQAKALREVYLVSDDQNPIKIFESK